jgi:hypothetical protein
MKCIIDAANIKVLSGAISCLSKIGKEIDIEVDKEAVSNAAHLPSSLSLGTTLE